jgi:hypothetical protein
MVPRSAVYILLIFTAWLSYGCNDDLTSSSSYNGPVNSCSSNSNCSQGICDREYGICAVDKMTEETVWAKVVLRNEKIFGQQLFKVLPNAKHNVTFKLKKKVSVKNIAPSIDGQVIFKNITNSANGDAIIDVYNAHKGKSAPFFLLPGKYQITILPSGDDKKNIPPVYLDNIELTESGEFKNKNGNPVEIKIVHSSDNMHTFFGRVYYESNPGQFHYANGLEVVALQTDGTRIVSSTVKTKCVDISSCGRFSIQLSPEVRDFRLAISKPEEPFYPVYYHAISNWEEENGPLVILPMPVVPAHQKGKVTIDTEDGLPGPVPPCEVLFELISDDDSTIDSAKLELWSKSDQTGQVESQNGNPGVFLYPGKYKITAFPSKDEKGNSEYAITSRDEPVEITGSDNTGGADVLPFTVALKKRLPIKGTVMAYKFKIKGALINAVPLSSQSGHVRESSSTSDTTGIFTMWMDESTYFVIGHAPLKSGFAAAIDLWQIIPVADDKIHNLSLSIPYILNGRVLLPDSSFTQNNFADGYIEWYIEKNGAWALIDRKALDKNGSFTVLLPGSQLSYGQRELKN